MSSRRPTRLVAGNWKMNTSVAEGLDLARAMRAELDGSAVEVEVLPPFTHLVGVRDVLRGSSLRLGAQNCYAEDKAFSLAAEGHGETVYTFTATRVREE